MPVMAPDMEKTMTEELEADFLKLAASIVACVAVAFFFLGLAVG